MIVLIRTMIRTSMCWKQLCVVDFHRDCEDLDSFIVHRYLVDNKLSRSSSFVRKARDKGSPPGDFSPLAVPWPSSNSDLLSYQLTVFIITHHMHRSSVQCSPRAVRLYKWDTMWKTRLHIESAPCRDAFTSAYSSNACLRCFPFLRALQFVSERRPFVLLSTTYANTERD